MSAPASSRNVNVACLACDGTRPCADCRAAGKALVTSGHRVHHSSRYAALRAAADGTYGFSACVVPVRAGERSISDSIVALLADTRVAIAAEDPAALPSPLPPNIVVFPRSDYLAGKLPKGWLDAQLSGGPKSPKAANAPAPAPAPARSAVRSDATRRLRSLPKLLASPTADAIALLNDELAWYRASGIGFALVSIRFIGARGLPEKLALEDSIRSGDSIAIIDDSVVMVLPGVDEQQAKQIAARCVGHVDRHNTKTDDVRLGIAVCPDDGETADALLALVHRRLAPRKRK